MSPLLCIFHSYFALKMEEESTRAEPQFQLSTHHLSLQTKSRLESRPEVTSHLKKRDKEKKVCTENAPNKSRLSAKEKGAQQKVENERNNDKNGTFWTVCPYCYYMYEYEKVFEECCLLCQNCKRAFHGVVVVEPNKKMLVEGNDGYYFGFPYFSFRNSLNGSEKKKESGGEGKSYKVVTVLEISDDSDDGGCGGDKGVNVKSGEGAKEDVLKGNVKGVKQGSGKTVVKNYQGKRVKATKNVKSVPRNSKKVMCRGVKSRRIIGGMGIGGSDSGSGTDGDGCETHNLEFIEKDGDVFVMTLL